MLYIQIEVSQLTCNLSLIRKIQLSILQTRGNKHNLYPSCLLWRVVFVCAPLFTFMDIIINIKTQLICLCYVTTKIKKGLVTADMIDHLNLGDLHRLLISEYNMHVQINCIGSNSNQLSCSCLFFLSVQVPNQQASASRAMGTKPWEEELCSHSELLFVLGAFPA